MKSAPVLSVGYIVLELIQSFHAAIHKLLFVLWEKLPVKRRTHKRFLLWAGLVSFWMRHSPSSASISKKISMSATLSSAGHLATDAQKNQK
jgi:beta-lactamase regulating signal transducer with metallopeptidase domain